VAEAVPVLLVGRLGLRWSVKAVSLFVSTRCVCRALAWHVRVLCMRCMIVHAVSCSCPGPALVSTASMSALAVVAGGQYAPDLNCSVTVYSPDGLGVALLFTTFDTVASNDSTWVAGRAAVTCARCASSGSSWMHDCKSACVLCRGAWWLVCACGLVWVCLGGAQM
jgi:hypothetical protein